MRAVMSVDAEEWFHIPHGTDNIIPYDKWNDVPARIPDVLPRMLDIFEKNRVTATFFFLGWIAEKYPYLVKETSRRGHEIASHGYAHKLIYNQTRQDFIEDISRSLSVLENLTGKKVTGYRAPGFSIIPDTEWAFEILINHGVKYDSSIFPGKRFLGHYEKFGKEPSLVKSASGEILEFPQTVISIGFNFSCFGGGYFRLFPVKFIRAMSKRVIMKNRSLILYIHPRDIDVLQPRIPFPFLSRVRHYINISKTEEKLSDISGSFDFTSFNTLVSDEKFRKEIESSTFDVS